MVHLERNDRSQNALMESYVEAMFSHLPTGATFLAIGDNHLFPVLYYHLVEKRRPDITLFNPEVSLGEKEQLPRLMSQGLFYSSHYLEAEPPFRVVPEGLVFKATNQFETARPIVWRDSLQKRGLERIPLWRRSCWWSITTANPFIMNCAMNERSVLSASRNWSRCLEDMIRH